MIYDVRTYEIAPGRVPDYMKNVKEIAIPIRKDYGVKLGGWYHSGVGALNQVVHIWAYEDIKHLVEGAEAVRADKRWTGEYMPANRGLVQSQRDSISVQAPFAPASYEPVEDADPRLYEPSDAHLGLQRLGRSGAEDASGVPASGLDGGVHASGAWRD